MKPRGDEDLVGAIWSAIQKQGECYILLEMAKPDSRQLNIWLKNDVRTALEGIAERWGVSKTAAIERAILVAFEAKASLKPEELSEIPLPKNRSCIHCGGRFAGARYATICPPCRDSKHQNLPADCPACHEGIAI